VTALPGPSPVTAALAIAGLPAGRFIVEGSPPRSAEVRERRFAELAAEPRTLIFTESPDRLGRTLAELAAALGAHRSAAVCRALSTADQDVERGTLGELAGRLAVAASGGRDAPADGARSGDGDGRGDVTLVVAGAPRQVTSAAALALEADALEGAVAQVRAQVRAGATTRDAVAAVAARAGVRKRDLYNAVGSSGTGAARPTDASGDRN
jgi:16S rRNA (cytidine1402-2'-O)-methyltransferase